MRRTWQAVATGRKLRWFTRLAGSAPPSGGRAVRGDITLPQGGPCRGRVTATGRGRVRDPPPFAYTSRARGRRTAAAWPGTTAVLLLPGTADTQQAALRDRDRARQRGQVVTGDQLGERGHHGRHRLVCWSHDEDPGMTARRVEARMSPSPRSNVSSSRPTAAATCGSIAPARFSSTTVSTSCPAAMSTWLAERGMFSSSLTFTRGSVSHSQ
jgi:hypothetical protein